MGSRKKKKIFVRAFFTASVIEMGSQSSELLQLLHGNGRRRKKERFVRELVVQQLLCGKKW
jgi:hypothetical protein